MISLHCIFRSRSYNIREFWMNIVECFKLNYGGGGEVH